MAHVCDCTGWTWDYVCNEIDLRRLKHLNRYWAEHPPLQAMVQAYLGIKPKDSGPVRRNEAENTEQDLDDFMRSFTRLGGTIG